MQFKNITDEFLEFATCAWAPHTKTGIHTIERLQRSAARFVNGELLVHTKAHKRCHYFFFKFTTD